MAKQTINIGTAANDGTGDSLRTAFQKAQSNFDELYTGAGGNFSSTDDTTTNATYYPVVVTAAAGSTAKTSSTKLSYNPSTGTLNSVIFNATSDVRLKTNIRDMGYGLADVLKLVGKKYEMLDGGQTQIGLIAQDVEKVIPEIVNTAPNTLKGINYPVLTAVLIEAVKELTARVEALEKANAS